MVAVLMSTFIPHFDLPFRLDGLGHAKVVDQDTIEDVTNCVAAILHTFKGQRDEVPSFGIDDPTFELQPLDLGAIVDAVIQQEPRAAMMMTQHPDQFNQLVAEIIATVTLVQGVSNG